MNTKLTVVLVIVIVVGLLLFVVWHAPQDTNAPATTNEANDLEEGMDTGETGVMDKTAVPTTGTASFAYLMNLGHSLECNVVYEPQSGTSVAATMYIDGERMRADSEMMMAGEVYRSHMIYDDDMMYTWNESGVSDTAVKFKVEDEDSDDDGRPISLDQDVEYDCQLWSTDAGMFVPPSDIEFMDMEDMMRGVPQMQ